MQEALGGVSSSSFSPPKGIRCFFYLTYGNCGKRVSRWFQSPEGDSLFFLHYPGRPGGSSGPQPVSVPRRGFVVFSTLDKVLLFNKTKDGFQSPEGDSLFFLLGCRLRCRCARYAHVSVPRRGFVVFSTSKMESFIIRRKAISVPRRGFVVFSTRPPQASRTANGAPRISVPRRGFVVFSTPPSWLK